ncbi:RICIN domain-containing protein [Streptomyces glomeratus]|uniref:Ricin B lectin domain-containing protein n=1 Tax=Streptomyces glomeratus TaxID=284452 RepID=A0ABP6M073_9ACTN|nr:RICIN domain-containing protein [Streptomyces glomeratus]MCF1506372.1 RICIN domain-containing protein [Streptomyces glomeratus]
MARADGTDNDVETTGGVHADASDVRLTELLRADTPGVYPALQELRARHRPSVLEYARVCTTSESAARQLAAQAFTLAAREAARGSDPGVPLRHHLLLLTVRLASSWARDERAGGLDPGLLLVLSRAGAAGPLPPMLAAFRSLPSRTQGLVWYGIVEGEPEDRTAVFLGLSPEDVADRTQRALAALGQASLRARLAASEDPRCGDFRRLIEESVRPDQPRYSTDLNAHMAHCPHCTAAFEELSVLRDQPRAALAEGLLPWRGTAYVTRRAAEPLAGTGAATGSWSHSRRLALASAALGVALVPLLLFLVSSGGSPEHSAPAAATPLNPPPVTVTTTVSAPAPTPSPTSASPSPSPSPSPSSTPSPTPSRTLRPKPTPKRTPSHAPNGTFAQVVNAASGLCLEVGGDFYDGTDVVMVPCTSSSSQRWRVDSERSVLQSSADPDFCLDSRGSVDRGVGVWECSSVYGRNGRNLMFTVDDDGVIRPAIAIETALTANDDGSLSLSPLTGGAEQRWRAGAT